MRKSAFKKLHAPCRKFPRTGFRKTCVDHYKVRSNIQFLNLKTRATKWGKVCFFHTTKLLFVMAYFEILISLHFNEKLWKKTHSF